MSTIALPRRTRRWVKAKLELSRKPSSWRMADVSAGILGKALKHFGHPCFGRFTRWQPLGDPARAAAPPSQPPATMPSGQSLVCRSRALAEQSRGRGWAQ